MLGRVAPRAASSTLGLTPAIMVCSRKKVSTPFKVQVELQVEVMVAIRQVCNGAYTLAIFSVVQPPHFLLKGSVLLRCYCPEG